LTFAATLCIVVCIEYSQYGAAMHVRVRRNKTGTTSVFVVACKRVKGKKNPQPLLVKTFGTSKDPKVIKKLYNEAQLFSSRNKYVPSLRIYNDSDIESSEIKNIGLEQVYGTILNQRFKLEDLELGASNTTVLRELILMRIAEPVSKLKTSELAAEFNCNNLSLNKIYKSMDKLTDSRITKIKQQIFSNTKKLLATDSLSVLFYDLTSIYFENNNTSELKMLGYSKDGKNQHVQINLALVVTKSGLPIDYEIFSGNTYEGKTLLPVLLKLRESYGIQDVTIVADSAMLSKSNIAELSAHGFNYIMAARVKNLNKTIATQMLSQENYIQLNEDLCYKTMDLNNIQLIACRSKKRAVKDDYERKVTVKRMGKYLGKSAKNTLRGSLKKPYVKLTADSAITLDLEQLENSKRFDGFFGFYTNTDLPPSAVIEQYRGLWQVEETFRITKHNLAIRPVYHYKDRRILAHFAVCFLALAVARTTEFLLLQNNLKISSEKLHQLLQQVNHIRVINKKQCFLITPPIPAELQEIYSALNIPKPKVFTSNIA